jgi:hypothetical protein
MTLAACGEEKPDDGATTVAQVEDRDPVRATTATTSTGPSGEKRKKAQDKIAPNTDSAKVDAGKATPKPRKVSRPGAQVASARSVAKRLQPGRCTAAPQLTRRLTEAVLTKTNDHLIKAQVWESREPVIVNGRSLRNPVFISGQVRTRKGKDVSSWVLPRMDQGTPAPIGGVAIDVSLKALITKDESVAASLLDGYEGSRKCVQKALGKG